MRFRDASQIRDELIATRRDIHMHPELGLQEVRTAALVEKRLREMWAKVQAGVGGTGVVAVLGPQEGKTLLLRADMDALPVQEENDVPYRSQVDGVMHACGHDAHTAMLLGVARLLSERATEMPGPVKLIFQPAEEGPGGAKRMIADGALEAPVPDACLACHVTTELPLGQVGLRTGPFFAAVDEVTITVQGQGGHGAYPHTVVDPIVTASQLVLALQTIVSRTVDPMQPAVVSIGRIHGGEKFNVIPSTVELVGTIRTFDEALRDRIHHRIRDIADGVCAAAGGTARVNIEKLYDVTVNDEAMTDLVRRAAADVVGPEKVIEMPRTMGGEDMSFFFQAAPGCYFYVGGANPEKGFVHSYHTSRFDFDEDAMVVGVNVMLKCVADYFLQDRAP
jgi:amidohydrolase